MVRFLLLFRDEQSPPDDLPGSFARGGDASPAKGFSPGRSPLLCGDRRLGVLGIRVSFAGSGHLEFGRAISLVRRSCRGALDADPETPTQLENRAPGVAGRHRGPFALPLHADVFRHQPSHELGLHQYQGGVLLFRQPKSVLRQTFRSTSPDRGPDHGSHAPGTSAGTGPTPGRTASRVFPGGLGQVLPALLAETDSELHSAGSLGLGGPVCALGSASPSLPSVGFGGFLRISFRRIFATGF